ncbi:hypothetical protein X943_000433 [Babesia divergens]|uniref:Uncharacterized protein n=1 Tax=Babesia divergens TaxID=32595 RepID=A0AAD9LK64_BABDI|nr:hypothetical protein X943_000433 [Babesia divergens]
MECSIRAVIQEHPTTSAGYVKLHDGRRRNLGVLPQLPLRMDKVRGFRVLSCLWEPLGRLMSELYNMLEMYYLTSQRPALVSTNTCEKEIVSYLGTIFVYLLGLCHATSSAVSNLSIRSFSLNFGSKLGSKAMVFKYGYFSHSISLTPSTSNRGVLLVSSFDKGEINISFSRIASQGLLQMTHISAADSEPIITSHALGFDGRDCESGKFITCVSVDPMPSLGTTIMVGYSTGNVEIWKESISVTNLRDALCEAVAQCRVPSYPFYCAFSPCGEIALLLTIDDMYLMEWTGSSLTGIKIVDGSSADFWASTITKVLAAEWLNGHEFLSLAENGQLWLSRRSEMGYWNRIAQYILMDGVPMDAGLTSWISRMQFDGHDHLFIKMSGSHQLMQLKWDKKAMPDLTIVEFPVKELGVKLNAATKEHAEGSRASGKLTVADFALEPTSALLAVVVSDRSMVCVYNYTNMRFAHVIDPPKPHLKVGGLKFLNEGNETQSLLAVKWVEMSLEIFQEDGDLDIDHKVSRKKGDASVRLTVIYALSNGIMKPPSWQTQTLADILSGNDNVTTSHNRGLKNTLFRRTDPLGGDVIPRLSIFKPTFPEKLITGSKNTTMFEDAFAHRGKVFGKHFPKNDNRIFPLETTHKVNSRADNPHLESAMFSRTELSRDREPNTPIYSMEEFTHRKRGGLR